VRTGPSNFKGRDVCRPIERLRCAPSLSDPAWNAQHKFGLGCSGPNDRTRVRSSLRHDWEFASHRSLSSSAHSLAARWIQAAAVSSFYGITAMRLTGRRVTRPGREPAVDAVHQCGQSVRWLSCSRDLLFWAKEHDQSFDRQSSRMMSTIVDGLVDHRVQLCFWHVPGAGRCPVDTFDEYRYKGYYPAEIEIQRLPLYASYMIKAVDRVTPPSNLSDLLKKLHVAHDFDTVLLAKSNHCRSVEIPVHRAKDVGSPCDRCINYRIIIGVG
jgi:hypothetical protein